MVNANQSGSNGSVLIAMVMLLAVLMLMVMAGLQIGDLEVKMCDHMQARAIALRAAEAELLRCEKVLFTEGKVNGCAVEVVGELGCGFTLYQITAPFGDGMIQNAVQSTVVLQKAVDLSCKENRKYPVGRLSWHFVSPV